ncbi:Mannose-6-phosphate isomerase OS=Sphingobium scionense OX=1404341 GN=GGQ90_002261 PE=4 SV=1 [Sphingobium scionense]|jgi:mannose-6-phosphate isomerase
MARDMSSYRLIPSAVEKPWGRRDLPAPFDMVTDRRIGEIWFTAEARVAQSLLVKYLFTSEKLSVQVHPDDAQAQAMGLAGGKSECWYVLATEGDARLGIGLTRKVDADALRAAALDGSIEALIDWKPVKPGDFYYIPAGTIHAIGGGITLVEVQQNNDVTYRLFDYGRPRELHLDAGMAVSAPEPYGRLPQHVAGDNSVMLVEEAGAPFTLESLVHDTGEIVRRDQGPFWFMPLQGSGLIDGQPWVAGECWLIEDRADIAVEQPLHALLARPSV